MKENINELIYLYHMKDEEALPRLIEHYRPMVHKVIAYHSLSQDFQDRQDFYVRADMDLVKCLELYQPDSGQNFSSYYYAALRNGAVDTLKSLRRKSALYREDTISLQGFLEEEKQAEHMLPVQADIHRQAMSRVELEEIWRKADPELRQILHHRMEGDNLIDTARSMHSSPRRIRYRLNGLLSRQLTEERQDVTVN